MVECTYGVTLGMARAVDGPVVREIGALVVHDGAITDLRRIITPPDYTVLYDPFNAWMQEHHPDDAEVVACCGWPSLDEARRERRPARPLRHRVGRLPRRAGVHLRRGLLTPGH